MRASIRVIAVLAMVACTLVVSSCVLLQHEGTARASQSIAMRNHVRVTVPRGWQADWFDSSVQFADSLGLPGMPSPVQTIIITPVAASDKEQITAYVLSSDAVLGSYEDKERQPFRAPGYPIRPDRTQMLRITSDAETSATAFVTTQTPEPAADRHAIELDVFVQKHGEMPLVIHADLDADSPALAGSPDAVGMVVGVLRYLGMTL